MRFEIVADLFSGTQVRLDDLDGSLNVYVDGIKRSVLVRVTFVIYQGVAISVVLVFIAHSCSGWKGFLSWREVSVRHFFS